MVPRRDLEPQVQRGALLHSCLGHLSNIFVQDDLSCSSRGYISRTHLYL